MKILQNNYFVAPANEVMNSTKDASLYLFKKTKSGNVPWASISTIESCVSRNQDYCVVEHDGEQFVVECKSNWLEDLSVIKVGEKKKEIFDFSNPLELERGDDSYTYQADGLLYKLKWHTGGNLGGEYYNTYNGELTFKDKQYKIYRHWSHPDLKVGIYENEILIGSVEWVKKNLLRVTFERYEN